ncbi:MULTISPECIES: glutamate mutase L [Cutibacterium]|uniref:glutamate mutase L n=1 Tax=Cutibacterium TaxID=1912216 RepID=UPI000203F744|nr:MULTISPECIES: glutamate mutase L [Cutibacterium]EGE76167.1 hypothetical protein HMPREF9344_00318 [Cutibacterium acnes HL097PA1]EIA11849.1 putative reactivating factor for D-ornithine aminomutase [Cutibacterium acnes PRP-38]REB13118.1 methylaspartate mutase [Cutibacterium acnes]REB17565.1 methylaspartate mutase [Cutibacterium acnes]TLG12335.1 methylaspartate mutase [Cutibacterium acnes]
MTILTTVEIGSTITKANAFCMESGVLHHIGQGFAPTSVADGDVRIGADAAITQMREQCASPLAAEKVFVNSSAAGGLRMSVHGLTRSMTARAAREAALGAGAIVTMTTVGAMDEFDLEDLQENHPNIILLAGGVDDGEKRIVVENAKIVASAQLGVPVIYAGNSRVRRHVESIFADAGQPLTCVENVFPDVDVLRVEPVRAVIHDVFNDHITAAPGMHGLAELTDHEILPTPGAVLLATELFADAVGDAVVVDVGGATTDIHSVTDGSSEWSARVIDPEPRTKRTVEGDLGVFVNARRVAAMTDEGEDEERLEWLRAIPGDEREAEVTQWLAREAVETGVGRHAGTVTEIFTPTGKTQVVRGKDLSAVRWVVGTGGALTRVPGGADILRRICTGAGAQLLPSPEATIVIDRDYRFSALGTIAQCYPDEVRRTFATWIESLTGSTKLPNDERVGVTDDAAPPDVTKNDTPHGMENTS